MVPTKQPHHKAILPWMEADRRTGYRYTRFMIEIQTRYPSLSTAEQRVCALVRAGMSSADIGKMLSVTEKTVENHRVTARRKIGLKREKRLDLHLQSAQYSPGNRQIFRG